MLTVRDCVSTEYSGSVMKAQMVLSSQMVLSRERLKDDDIVFVTRMMDYVVTAKVMQAVNTARFTGFAFEPVKVI